MPAPTDHFDPDDLPKVPGPAFKPPRMVRRPGRIVVFHYQDDGTVTATTGWATGFGWTEEEAVADLDRLLKDSVSTPTE